MDKAEQYAEERFEKIKWHVATPDSIKKEFELAFRAGHAQGVADASKKETITDVPQSFAREF